MTVSTPSEQHAGRFGSRWIALALILLAAVATRFWTFGNPIANGDEQFYLLVGDAMRHGQMPYTDIWDRKPFGLFALFWAMAVVGNGSPLVVKLIATAFAVGTGMVVRRIALFFTGASGATLAGVAYVLTLPLFGGQWAQAPVFFNLFVALAALALVGAVGQPAAGIHRRAMGAMLWCGLALSIKQVAVVEGAFFGLAFLWLMWRAGTAVGRLVATGAAMIAIALLPTALSLAGYALAGREALDAYVYANFLSIFDKTSFGDASLSAGIQYFLIFMGPLLVMAVIGLVLMRRKGAEPVRFALLAGWIVAAFGGYLIVPYFFDQYALPLVAPLCVAAAALLSRSTGPVFVGVLGLYAFLTAPGIGREENRSAARVFKVMTQVVDEARQGGCLLVNDGPNWLYHSTGACTVTRYLFPGHLNLVTEAGAVGVDTREETIRALGQRPAVIVTQDSAFARHNPVTRAIVLARLKRDYRLAATFRSEASKMVDTVWVWQRRDLPPPSEVRP